MKISKRLIALFICLCMMVTCFGVVLAEETTPNTSEIVLAEEKTPNTSEVVTVTDDPTTMAAPAGYLAYYDPSLASGTPGFIGTNTAEL
ncbi:MAG: hypothetical protein RR957_07780, partial [Oscillospiraceae bacterium]